MVVHINHLPRKGEGTEALRKKCGSCTTIRTGRSRRAPQIRGREGDGVGTLLLAGTYLRMNVRLPLPDGLFIMFSIRLHSVSVHLMEAGFDVADVQDWVGHKSITSTLIYAKVTSRWRNKNYLRMRHACDAFSN